MRGKRTPGKSSDTLQSAKVRFVKFTPEEMAYNAPPDVSDPKRYPIVARDVNEWKKFLTFKRGFTRLDPDVRKAFPDDQAVNEALRLLVSTARNIGGRRKTA